MGVFQLAFLVRFLSKPAPRRKCTESEPSTTTRTSRSHRGQQQATLKLKLSHQHCRDLWSSRKRSKALSGFITASAILIILSQVKPAIGLPLLGPQC